MSSAIKKSLSNPSQVVKSPSSPLLVNRHISEQNHSKGSYSYNLDLYPRSCKIDRGFRFNVEKRGIRGDIDGFSKASKRRLKFTAGNALPLLISQFGMTYHNCRPSGREAKKHLHGFFVKLRRAYKGMGYLWVLEFQTRGVAHFHLFLTEPVNYGLHQFMAGIWNEIVEPGDDEHLRVHMHSKNFIPWDMGAGGYLCKYLDKEHQKIVPDDFLDVGRFWGSSRGLVPDPEKVSSMEIDGLFSHEFIDKETGEIEGIQASKFILRQICKAYEKSLRGHKWKSRARKTKGRYTLPSGTIHFRKFIDYLSKSPPF